MSSLSLSNSDFIEKTKNTFQNVNYSQWERSRPQPERERKKSASKSNIIVSKKPTQNSSAICNHNHEKTQPTSGNTHKTFYKKTRKQLALEEEKRRLKEIKINNIKLQIEALKQREIDLAESNMVLREFIDTTEKNALDSVNDVLRKYEKFKNVLDTTSKRHAKDIRLANEELSRIKEQINVELPILEKDVDELQQELDSKQELYKLLSIYKNQEYPEKLLIIKNLQKELVDMKNVHEEEKAELIEMITKETNRFLKIQIENENASVDRVTKKLTDQMHESLKDMAVQNGIMEKEKIFHLEQKDMIKTEIEQLKSEIQELLNDDRRHIRKMMFPEFYRQHKICHPDEEVLLNL